MVYDSKSVKGTILTQLFTCRRTGPTSGTDTDSTPEHLAVGGLGKYSHGTHNLVHHHWPEQAEIAGGFNVHNTEAAEAFHKECMVLPTRRVRHSSTRNITYASMQQYTLQQLLFTSLKVELGTGHPAPLVRRSVADTGKPLRLNVDGSLVPVKMGSHLEKVSVQRRILHPEARIGRVELMDLVCNLFSMNPCRSSYTRLACLDWGFYQRMTMLDGTVFWATDSEYSFASHGRRRDCFVLKDNEQVQVRMPNGELVTRDTALCCQATCFVKLGKISPTLDPRRVSKEVQQAIRYNSLTLVLVRFFEAHPSATERTVCHLPLCPAPFNINHALWRYAVTDKPRALLFDEENNRPTKHFDQESFMFGSTRREQLNRLDNEKHAYHSLVLPSRIKSRAAMAAEFELNTTRQSSTWLQTINM